MFYSWLFNQKSSAAILFTLILTNIENQFYFQCKHFGTLMLIILGILPFEKQKISI